MVCNFRLPNWRIVHVIDKLNSWVCRSVVVFEACSSKPKNFFVGKSSPLDSERSWEIATNWEYLRSKWFCLDSQHRTSFSSQSSCQGIRVGRSAFTIYKRNVCFVGLTADNVSCCCRRWCEMFKNRVLKRVESRRILERLSLASSLSKNLNPIP